MHGIAPSHVLQHVGEEERTIAAPMEELEVQTW